MTAWDTQTFDFRSYPFADLQEAFFVSALTLVGSQDLEWRPERAVELTAGDFTLALFEILEDKALDQWSTLRVDMDIRNIQSIGDDYWIQAICEDTRLELAVRVDSSGPLSVELPVHDLRGRLRLRLVATSTDSHSAGLVIAASRIFEATVDRPALLPGGGLRFEWNSERFQDRKDALFSIEFGRASQPVVFLNQTIPGFEPVLSSHRGGSVGAARRFLLSLLETEVRLELLRLAALRIASAYEREDIESFTDSELGEELEATDYQILRMGVEKLGTARDPEPVAALLRALNSAEGHESARLRLVGIGSDLGRDLASLIESIEKRG